MLKNLYDPYSYFLNIELPCSVIFQAMSNRGIRIDLPYLYTLKDKLEAHKRPIEDEIKNELGSINLNSPKQLLEALNAKEIYPKFKGKPSTDKRALESLKGNRTVLRLLDFSQLSTLLSSFIYPYLERGQEIVHPFFNQCGTRTGRLSCSNPNLLQIPKHSENGKLVRRMFIPREDTVFGDCDFGQIEPRVLAHFSKDQNLCQMFNEGTDFHSFTAEKLKITRDKAKVLNLSVGYRATFKSVAQQLQCNDTEAQNEIDKWWGLFPNLHRWQETAIYNSRRSGYCTTLMGHRIRIEGLSSYKRWERESAERQLINNITQGSAAEIMKLSMIKINEVSPNTAKGLLVQVYDELLFEENECTIEDCVNFIKGCMETSIKLDIPLVVDAKSGPNWGDVN